MDLSNITTAFELPNFRVIKNYGIAKGIVVRSRSIVGNIGAAFERLMGGNITLFEELCENTRQEAKMRMIAEADQLGANAIIGFRYDATELADGVTEVLAYGTAVTVEKT